MIGRSEIPVSRRNVLLGAAGAVAAASLASAAVAATGDRSNPRRRTEKELHHEHNHHQGRHRNLLQGLGQGPVVTFSHGWLLSSDAWDGQMLFLAMRRV